MLLNELLKLSWGKTTKFLVLTAAIITVSAFCIVFYNYLSIKQIEIRGVDNLMGVKNFRNTNLFFLDLDKTKTEILANNSQLANVYLEKIYPNKLVITAIESKNLVALEVANGFFILNDVGRVSKKVRSIDRDYPTISLYQRLNFNQQNIGSIVKNGDVIQAIFFINKLKEMGVSILVAKVHSADMIEAQTNSKTYLFSSVKDPQLQIEELKIILERFSIEKMDYKKIDLRFDKPVIGIE